MVKPHTRLRSDTFGLNPLDQGGDDRVGGLDGGVRLFRHQPGGIRGHYFGLLDIGIMDSQQLPTLGADQRDTDTGDQPESPATQRRPGDSRTERTMM